MILADNLNVVPQLKSYRAQGQAVVFKGAIARLRDFHKQGNTINYRYQTEIAVFGGAILG